MTVVGTLLTIVAPVFLIVAAGYIAVRTRFFPESLIDGVVRYAVAYAVPCLLFLSMTRIDLATAISPGSLVAYFLAGNACFFVAMFLSRLIWNRRPGESVAVGFSTFFSNVVMLGIPIADRAFGPEVLAGVFGIIAFHSIHNYLVGFIAMEMVRQDRAGLAVALGRAFVTTFRNPLMIGLVSGLAFNLSGFTLPRIPLSALEMIAQSAIPAALFSLGGILTRYQIRREASEALMVAGFSLIVHPALAWWLAGPMLGLEPTQVRTVVVLAAMPAGLNGYIFATLYNRAVGTNASSALLGTALSVMTISIWLALLGA